MHLYLVAVGLVLSIPYCIRARLAQSVERQPFKLVVVGSSPTVGVFGKVLTSILLPFVATVRADEIYDSCGIRTHALSDQRLKLAP